MSADNGMSYDLAVQKGFRLAWSFSANTPPSRWQNFKDLDNFGWAMEYHQQPGDENGAPLPQDESKVNMYHDLRLSDHSAYNFKCTMRHMFDNGGFSPTRGFYSCVYNPNAILAHASESPDYKGAQHLHLHGLPIVPLKHWSDVVFLKWAECCAHWRTPLTGLRAIIQCDVNNKTTERIVYTALERTGMELKQWPKREWQTRPRQGAATFPLDSPECQAILATPNGVGPVHLLTQHQWQLGKMMISGVTAFARLSFGANPAPLNLVFHVVPVG